MLLRTSVGMLRRGGALGLPGGLSGMTRASAGAAGVAPAGVALQRHHDQLHQHQKRAIGSWIPEFWGKKSKYTEGTDFLGTPENHLDLIKKRPISPDVLTAGVDNADGILHYKMPVAAISSITNRVTGIVLTGGFTLVGAIGLVGDVPTAIEIFKETTPLLVVPAKLAVTFPVIYHYLAGLRHLFWDTYQIGNQTQSSFLDKKAVETSSNILFATSFLLSGLVTAM